ncbi:MAG: right-handed parallel beta-helix repeat-containing protein, partial [Bdellovibrionales bacterium]|nr:right-handed parallel beta-helix repeat-containing protein [Bdellovibrionales bacterium]
CDGTQWLLDGFKGEKGDRGDEGNAGAQGAQGLQGLQGERGTAGSQGLQGIRGLQGVQGVQGIQGIQGAKGDSGSDDILVDAYLTGSNDSTTGIRAAIRAAGDARKCVSFTAAKHYVTSGTIEISREAGIPLCVRGNNAVIEASAAGAVVRLVNPHLFAYSSLFFLENLEIQSKGMADYGLEILGAQRIRVSGVRTSESKIAGFHLIGANGAGIYYNQFSDWYSYRDYQGLRAESLDIKRINANTFVNTNFAFCSDVGVYFDKAESNYFEGGSIEKTGKQAIHLVDSTNMKFNTYVENHAYDNNTRTRNPNYAAFRLDGATNNFSFKGRVTADAALTKGLLEGDARTTCHTIESAQFNGGIPYRTCDGVTYDAQRFGESSFYQQVPDGGRPERRWGVGTLGTDHPHHPDSFYIYQYNPGGQGGYRVLIDDNGNVGIGTTEPKRTAHISGVMRLEPQTQAPAAPANGDIYFHQSGALCVYSNSRWEKLNQSGSCP